MAINSIVVVAEDTDASIGTPDISLSFARGSTYPVETTLRLTVRDQPFPEFVAPTRVVPAIQSVFLSYGRFDAGEPTSRAASGDLVGFAPDEHWLRELTFSARYTDGSWRVDRDGAAVDIVVSAGLRDNTPAGEASQPDDPFVAQFKVQALCIWTELTLSLLDRIRGIGGGIFVRP